MTRWWRRFLKAPRFWYETPDLAAKMLGPVARHYGERVAARMARPGERIGIPVVCIGNFTVGGAGKTPLALTIAGMLADLGMTPFFLTRGYGGTVQGPVLVGAGHGAVDVGDEALLLARQAPTVVSADRVSGARLALAEGADIVVMDDGFQNPSLAKDCTIVAVDGETGIGNGLTFPAGPLRASIHAQMPLASAVVIVGTGTAGARVEEFARGSGRDVFSARIALARGAPDLRGKRVLAFSGIGRPQKFFKTLADLGAVIAATEVFPDHHAFTEADATRIAMQAQSRGLLPVTTSKDKVRLGGGAARDALASLTLDVPVTLILDDNQGMLRFLRHMLPISEKIPA